MTDIEVVLEDPLPPIEVVVGDAQAPIEVIVQPAGVAGPAGPPGPQGPPGNSQAANGIEYLQDTPLATWTFPHELGRRPDVAVYVDDELVLASVVASDTSVTITFPAPVSGSVILN